MPPNKYIPQPNFSVGTSKTTSTASAPKVTTFNSAIAMPVVEAARQAVLNGTMTNEGLNAIYNQYNVPYPMRISPTMSTGEVEQQNISSGGGTTYKDTTASQNATQAAIDANATALTNGLAGVTSKFDRLGEQYADEYVTNENEFNTQTTSNEQTKANNTQASLLAAAQGGRGMRATLASLGALDGTGQMLSNRAVASSANADLGAGNRVFDTNATQINKAWDDTKLDHKRRDDEMKLARTDEEAEVRRTNAEFLRDLYKDMAGYKADAGDKAGADDYTNRMGALAPQVVNSKPASSPYAKRDIKYEAGKLGSYLGGMNDMTVKTQGGAAGASPAINSPLYSLTQKRDKELV